MPCILTALSRPDLGSAVYEGTHMSQQDSFTFAYSAPEKLEVLLGMSVKPESSHVLTCAMDIWSLGCMLFEVVTLRQAWDTMSTTITPPAFVLGLHAQTITLEQGWSEALAADEEAMCFKPLIQACTLPDTSVRPNIGEVEADLADVYSSLSINKAKEMNNTPNQPEKPERSNIASAKHTGTRPPVARRATRCLDQFEEKLGMKIRETETAASEDSPAGEAVHPWSNACLLYIMSATQGLGKSTLVFD